MVNVKIKHLAKDQTWHNANSTLVVDVGRIVILLGSNPLKFKIGDGITQLQNLEWSNGTKTLAEILAKDNKVNGLAISSNNGKSLSNLFDTFASFGWFGAKEGSVLANDDSLIVYHEDLVELNAPSITKNGDEILTSANITQTITNGVTDKAPSEDAVFDALALKRSSTYETLLFTGSFSAINLADSTTYFFGTLPSLPPQATASLCRLGFNQNLTITKVILTCSQGTNYSNEAVSVYLRKDNTTDNTITTSLDLSSVGLNSARIFSYSTNISVLSSSYYEVKIVTPAFATNGTNSRWHIQLYGY